MIEFRLGTPSSYVTLIVRPVVTQSYAAGVYIPTEVAAKKAESDL